MKCPKCSAENPETRKFCRECGNRFLLICSQCDTENLPGDKFCSECGHKLSLPSETPKDLSFDEKLNKIQRYPSTLEDFRNPIYDYGVLDQFYEAWIGTVHLNRQEQDDLLTKVGFKNIQRMPIGKGIFDFLTAEK